MADIRPLAPALQKKAIEELNEVPSRVAEDIEALREWIKKQPHLKARTSDQFLVAFLRGCKFSLEKAKQKIDKFYTLGAALSEIVKNRNTDDPKIRELIRLGITVRLPIPLNGEDGPRISVTRSGLHDPEKFAMSEVIKVSSMLGTIQMLEDDNAVISGVIEVMDMAAVTRAHFFQLQPSMMKKLSIFAEEAMPIRQKGVHFINTPAGFETVFNAIRNVLGEKTKSRISVHGSKMDEFYKHVPKKYLPSEYGGEAGSINDMIKYWEEKIISYHKFFLEEDDFGTDETLRVGGAFNFESVFGVEGSFRKLDVD